MGIKYFGGKNWRDISREERFFCLQLYARINAEGVDGFVAHLRDVHGYDLDPEAGWELAYEACFYRDFWHHRLREGPLYSPKRTFDLALFSDDVIVIIEAKAAEEFDDRQTASFVADKAQVIKETGVSRVVLIGLCSSRYVVPEPLRASFDGPFLNWAALAARYDKDQVLARGDLVFDEGPATSNNVSGFLTGAQIVAACDAGERFFVGRRFGIKGVVEDVAAGIWREQRYQTNREAGHALNRNWFCVEAFAAVVAGKPA
ncbi:MAG: hypothetical protein Q8O67_11010 [Deltaproteobacteria bacterium]|nr:hypothetical protein [Deltaproteobacteria bacterium]